MAIVMKLSNTLKGKEIRTGDVVKIVGEADYRMDQFGDEEPKKKFFIPVDYKGSTREIKMGLKTADKLAEKMVKGGCTTDTKTWIGKDLVLTKVDYEKGPGIQVEPLAWSE